MQTVRRPVLSIANIEPAQLDSVSDVRRFVGDVLNEVASSRLDPKVGNCVAVLASVMLRCLIEGEQEAIIRQQAERLARLEDATRRRA